MSGNFTMGGRVEKVIIIDDNSLPPTYVIHERNSKFVVLIVIFSIVFLSLGSYIVLSRKDVIPNINYVTLEKVDVLSYDATKNLVELSIFPSSNQEECFFDIEGKERVIGTIEDGKCLLNVSMDSGTVTFVNKYDLNSKSFEIKDYVVDMNEKDKYYLPLNKEIELGKDMVAVGNPDIEWLSVSESIQIIDGKLKAVKVGNSVITAVSNGKVLHEINVVVTDTIVEMPKKFNKKKEYLPCKEFTEEEAKLLDEILEYRVNEVGYGTRAAAVEVARFLTLEFPYRITYFYETGRLDTPGRAKVDGEGRYYHKGLYLSETKFNNLAYVGNGPAIWGCGLRCYEDAPPYFKPGLKYPNGLSCSGFVTWVLYNAGFDVGDIGAGESAYPRQLTDTGKFTSVTPSLIKSGKIKVGDLFNVWGHISILVGEDSKNYYIAESLDLYGGVVINTYSKSTVKESFPYVVLMDEVYKEDGNLTDLWY
jgi:hypothetical protein